jgi:acyl transferase domain-containing protein
VSLSKLAQLPRAKIGQIPREPTQWPTQGLRRASVNSFGVGGSNAHVVLDDAYHFLEAHGLTGNTNTKIQLSIHNSTDIIAPPGRTTGDKHTSNTQFVLIWSSGDESGISRIAQQFAQYAKSLTHCQQELMSNLAYTLNHRRSLLRHRSFAVVTSIADLENLETQISAPANTSPDSPRIGFVFTGQGAIWPKVAQELYVYSSFLRSLKEAEQYLEILNCPWKLTGKCNILHGCAILTRYR